MNACCRRGGSGRQVVLRGASGIALLMATPTMSRLPQRKAGAADSETQSYAYVGDIACEIRNASCVAIGPPSRQSHLRAESEAWLSQAHPLPVAYALEPF